MRTFFFLFGFLFGFRVFCCFCLVVGFFFFLIVPIISAGKNFPCSFFVALASFTGSDIFPVGQLHFSWLGEERRERTQLALVGLVVARSGGQSLKFCGSSGPASQPCLTFVHHLALFQ